MGPRRYTLSWIYNPFNFYVSNFTLHCLTTGHDPRVTLWPLLLEILFSHENVGETWGRQWIKLQIFLALITRDAYANCNNGWTYRAQWFTFITVRPWYETWLCLCMCFFQLWVHSLGQMEVGHVPASNSFGNQTSCDLLQYSSSGLMLRESG